MHLNTGIILFLKCNVGTLLCTSHEWYIREKIF